MATLVRSTPELSISTEISNFEFEFALTGVETKAEEASLQSALDEVRLWLSAIMEARDPYWLLLCGVSGNGKTHLAQKAAEFLRKYGHRAYETFRATVDPQGTNDAYIFSYRQEQAFFKPWDDGLLKPAKGGNYGPLERAGRDWCKIIDDLGSEQKERDTDKGGLRPTPFAQGQLTSLMDTRLRKWTLCTSNYGIAQFAEIYDARVADRFLRFPNRVVEVKASSFSLRMKKAESK